jgi:hypothetical protein
MRLVLAHDLAALAARFDEVRSRLSDGTRWS